MWQTKQLYQSRSTSVTWHVIDLTAKKDNGSFLQNILTELVNKATGSKTSLSVSRRILYFLYISLRALQNVSKQNMSEWSLK